MRTIVALFGAARARAHIAVFHAFAEGLARVLARRPPQAARVRAVGR
jgi:hypothetical protein